MNQEQTLPAPGIHAVLPVEASSLISVCKRAMPELDLTLIQNDGQVIGTASEWTEEQIKAVLAAATTAETGESGSRIIEFNGQRLYPLNIGGQLAGVLVSRSSLPDAARFEEVLNRCLSLLLDQSGFASEQAESMRAAQTRARQLETIMEITRELSSTLDLEKLLALIMHSARDILRAGAGSLFLVDEATNDLVFRVITSDDSDLIGKHIPFGKGIVGQVASTGKPIIVRDVDDDSRPFRELDHSGFITVSLLAVPLRVPDRLIGVVELINKVDGTEFDDGDVAMLTTFAAQAAIAIENARLYKTTLENQRMEQELSLAYKVQASLIPQKTPHLPGWEFAAWWQPAREVSGDFYDFIGLDGQAGIVIADVSDKGMHAALFMALTRSTVRAASLTTHSPAESLTYANRLVCADSVGGMFVTLFYAQIDLADHKVTYVNCGHNPPMWYHKADNSIIPLKRTAVMMGFDDSMQCQQREIEMEPGDALILYTDGVTEAFNEQHEQFDDTRLEQVIRDSAGGSAQDMLTELQGAIKSFTGSTPQSDDVTVVIIRRL
jgi:phosphoserine phosphatase RsbU/P